MNGSQLAIAEFRDGPRQGVVASLVACYTCGELFTLRPRTMRDLRAQRRLPQCGTCRRPPKVEPTAELVLVWLTLHTMAELVALAHSAFGPRKTWAEPELPAFEAVMAGDTPTLLARAA